MEQTALTRGPQLRLKKTVMFIAALSLLALIPSLIINLFYSYEYSYYRDKSVATLITVTPTFRQYIGAFLSLAAPALLLDFLLLYPAKPKTNILLPLMFAVIAMDFLLSITKSAIPEGADEATIAAIRATNTLITIIFSVPAALFALTAVCSLMGLLRKVFVFIPAGLMSGIYLIILIIAPVSTQRQLKDGATLSAVSYVLNPLHYLLLFTAIILFTAKNTIPPFFPLFNKKKEQ